MLSVVYLVYNAGADNVERVDLRGEAIRLGRVLAELMADEPEVAGLLALYAALRVTCASAGW